MSAPRVELVLLSLVLLVVAPQPQLGLMAAMSTLGLPPVSQAALVLGFELPHGPQVAM